MMPSIPLIETGRVTVYEKDGFRKVKVYYLGHIHGLANSHFIYSSYTGQKETEVTLCLVPFREFTVIEQAKGASA